MEWVSSEGNQGEQGHPIHSNGDWLIESQIEFLTRGVINIQWCEVECASNKKECVKCLKWTIQRVTCLNSAGNRWKIFQLISTNHEKPWNRKNIQVSKVKQIPCAPPSGSYFVFTIKKRTLGICVATLTLSVTEKNKQQNSTKSEFSKNCDCHKNIKKEHVLKY